MKILPKKTEIILKKNNERKLEIEEGVKLAKTIDQLRKTKVEEEASLRRFRSESLGIVKKEIDSYISQRDSLIEEVESLKRSRSELQKPLSAEWDKVKKEKDDLKIRGDSILKREDDLHTNLMMLETRKKVIDSIEDDTKMKNLQIEDLFNQAKKDRHESNDIRQKVDLYKSITEADLSHREKEIKRKELDIQYQLTDINNKLQQIERDRKFIMEEKIRLLDREKTLDRAFKRLNKK